MFTWEKGKWDKRAHALIKLEFYINLIDNLLVPQPSRYPESSKNQLPFTMASIAQDVPYDILGQIFLLCLPSDPLSQRQPDVTQAPMLLCQICSHWRSVALNTPMIWTQLYHVSTVVENVIHDEPQLQRIIRASDLDFFHWWRENVGMVAPSLRLSLESKINLPELTLQLVDLDKCAFLVNFLSSARYLDLDHYYSTALRDMLGYRPLICPNLDTLLLREGIDRKSRLVFNNTVDVPNEEYNTHTLIPTNAAQPIRRVFIENISITSTEVKQVMAWSHLTHICTANLTFTLDTWFALIRECVNLVYGDLSIYINSDPGVFVPPPTATLPQLRQLVIFTFGSMIRGSLFQSLTLPSLDSLRIDYFPCLSITHLHLILGSTPALKELHLAPNNPWDDIRNDVWFPGPQDTITPLWTVVPNLEFIHFGGREFKNTSDNTELVSKALHSSWLGLARLDNRIKQVEFAVGNRRDNSREELDRLVRELRQETPSGVELVVRAADAPALWKDLISRGSSLVGCFEDLKFREVV